MNKRSTDGRSLAPAGLVLGFGFGGFLDGILFHQIFQLHNMLSGKLPPDTLSNMRTNMAADGFFHAGMWVISLTGLALLWKVLSRPHEDRPSAAALVAWMIAGWGWFNLLEGLIDHQLLGIHHVVESRGLSIFDWLFLASGVILIICGHISGRRTNEGP